MGPHPDAKLEVAESEQEKGATKALDTGMPQNQRPTFPTFEPQVWLLKGRNCCYRTVHYLISMRTSFFMLLDVQYLGWQVVFSFFVLF